MDSINKVNKLNKSDFISIFGNVFEKTEWIAERVFNYLPYENFDNLFLKFFKIYNESNKESIIKILNSHPELVVEQKLTNESKNEQKGAGLNECSKEEVEEFKKISNLTGLIITKLDTSAKGGILLALSLIHI